MADNTKTSKALLSIALKTCRAEILEDLTGSKRYIGAMVANALDIAERSPADVHILAGVHRHFFLQGIDILVHAPTWVKDQVKR